MERSLVSAPTVEVILRTEAKNHLRVDVTDDDTLIDGYTTAARQKIEEILRRALVSQTWDFFSDGFPSSGEFEIPLPPLKSITYIKYLDTNGVEQTLSSGDYVVDIETGPTADKGRVRLAYGKSWPSIRSDRRSVRIRALCGYGEAGTDVPAAIRSAILLTLGTLYENRQDVITGTIAVKVPDTVDALLALYRVFEFQ